MATGGPCSDIIKFGYVEFKSKHIKTLRKRWLVLYGGTWSAPRLVKYTDEKHAKQCPDGRHVYYMSDIISIERTDSKDHAIKIRLTTEERDIFFCCDSEAGANEWIYCINKTMSGSRDVFHADLFHATHMDAPNNVTIRIADVYVTLIKDGVQFLEIPMTTIRKYQMDKDNVFWIETGRSCPIGEGFLYFRSELAQHILTRLHELASQGGERRQSLPNSSARPSHTHPTSANVEPRRPSLPSSIGSRMKLDRMEKQVNPYETAVRSPPPGPQEYSPFPRRYHEQGPNEEFPRIPLSQSLGRINERGEAGFGNSDRWHDERLNQSFSGIQRKKSGTMLVAASRPSLPPRYSPEPIPYMEMQNKVAKKVTNVKTEEGNPYTDMKNPVDTHVSNVKPQEEFPYTNMGDRGVEDIPGSDDDYLTPFSTRPDAKHYGEKRNS